MTTPSIQHYSSDDILRMFSIDNQQKYNELSAQLKLSAVQLNQTNDTYNILQTITHVSTQLQQLITNYTNITSIDTFISHNTNTKQSCQLLSLHKDILINICQYILPTDLINLRSVCVQLRTVIYDTRVWQYFTHCSLTSNYDATEYDTQLFSWYLRIYQPTRLYILNDNFARFIQQLSVNQISSYISHRLKYITELYGRANSGDVTSLLPYTPNVQFLEYNNSVERLVKIIHAVKYLQQINLSFKPDFKYIQHNPRVVQQQCTTLQQLSHIPRVHITINIESYSTYTVSIDTVQSTIDQLLQISNIAITVQQWGPAPIDITKLQTQRLQETEQ